MKLFQLIQAWFKKAFHRKSRELNAESRNALQERQSEAIVPEITKSEQEEKFEEEDLEVGVEEVSKQAESTDKEPLPLPKESFQACKIDFNTYKLFFPNWGDLDPTVSTISDGRVRKDFINILYDEFVNRYGNLTTDLGYGLIYSIVMNAIEKEDRSVSSALREAIVRSNDPLLCVAVVKDYCQRKSIQFDKYERITLDILKKRETFYKARSGHLDTNSPIDFTTIPRLPQDEQQELNKSSWLFNATLVEIYPKRETKKAPLYLMVKIPTLKNSQIVREFNRSRYWKEHQNLVIQWDGEDIFRVLDFK